MEYVHQPLNQPVTAIGGYYILQKDVRLPYLGREVLYVVGHAAFETSCCGPGGCAYAFVPGFILRWKEEIDADGLSVSQIEPIRDAGIRHQVQRLIEQQEIVHQVQFQ